MDDYVSLAWRPSVPHYPRVPVTYAIEMSKLPDGEWKLYKSGTFLPWLLIKFESAILNIFSLSSIPSFAGIRDSCADVRGLEPNKDYRFRIRVENKFGISDPSPYTTAYRSKVQLPSPTPKSPRDYEIEHQAPDKMGSFAPVADWLAELLISSLKHAQSTYFIIALQLQRRGSCARKRVPCTASRAPQSALSSGFTVIPNRNAPGTSMEIR